MDTLQWKFDIEQQLKTHLSVYKDLALRKLAERVEAFAVASGKKVEMTLNVDEIYASATYTNTRPHGTDPFPLVVFLADLETAYVMHSLADTISLHVFSQLDTFIQVPFISFLFFSITTTPFPTHLSIPSTRSV